jgi:hypothetical protein
MRLAETINGLYRSSIGADPGGSFEAVEFATLAADRWSIQRRLTLGGVRQLSGGDEPRKGLPL